MFDHHLMNCLWRAESYGFFGRLLTVKAGRIQSLVCGEAKIRRREIAPGFLQPGARTFGVTVHIEPARRAAQW